MSQAETNLVRKIMVAISRAGGMVQRVNAGMGWAGKVEHLGNGVVLIRNAAPFHGVDEGVSDLIGYIPVTITPDMVGMRVAVFLGPEVKTETGARRTAQERFVDTVTQDGGIAGFVRSEADAQALIQVRPGQPFRGGR